MNTGKHRKPDISSAVILSGGVRSNLYPLTLHKPKVLLPLVHRTLLEHLIDSLMHQGVDHIAVTLNEEDLASTHFFENLQLRNAEAGVKISYFFDDLPTGTAGTLKKLQHTIDEKPFLLVTSNLFLNGLDLSQMAKYHYSTGATATVAAHHHRNQVPFIEKIEISQDNQFERFTMMHPSKDRRQSVRTAGLYIFSPGVFDHIPDGAYFDIKEQLLPKLKKDSLKVSVFDIDHQCIALYDIKDYFNLTHFIFSRMDRDKGFEQIADNIWSGANSRISRKAYLLGPVFIGDNCFVEEHAQIIGPACIGNGCRIGTGALVRESILWDDVEVGANAQIEYSIVDDSVTVPGKDRARNLFISRNGEGNGRTALPQSNGFAAVAENQSMGNNGKLASLLFARLRRTTYLATKRILDLVMSSVSLLVLSPLFGLIALGIKLTSPGPVFYSQLRCREHGREFRMYKFRTMIENADELQERYAEQKDVDGPMFKLKRDPRVTAIGRILRRTNLDELPQLLNIF